MTNNTRDKELSAELDWFCGSMVTLHLAIPLHHITVLRARKAEEERYLCCHLCADVRVVNGAVVERLEASSSSLPPRLTTVFAPCKSVEIRCVAAQVVREFNLRRFVGNTILGLPIDHDLLR